MKKVVKYTLITFGVMFGGFYIIGMVTSFDEAMELESVVMSHEDSVKYMHDTYGVHVRFIAVEAVKSSLKSPESAKLPDPAWDADRFSTQYDYLDSAFRTSFYVDAPNSFGVMLRKKFRAEMKFIGDPEQSENWILTDLKTLD